MEQLHLGLSEEYLRMLDVVAIGLKFTKGRGKPNRQETFKHLVQQEYLLQKLKKENNNG